MKEPFRFGSCRHLQLWLTGMVHCCTEKAAVRGALFGKLHTGDRYENNSRVMD